MDANTIAATAVPAELITALFSTDGTVIVDDLKTGELKLKPLARIQDSPRFVVQWTREQVVAAAVAALTTELALERAL